MSRLTLRSTKKITMRMRLIEMMMGLLMAQDSLVSWYEDDVLSSFSRDQHEDDHQTTASNNYGKREEKKRREEKERRNANRR